MACSCGKKYPAAHQEIAPAESAKETRRIWIFCQVLRISQEYPKNFIRLKQIMPQAYCVAACA
jgi:hypothetical protein